MKPDGTKDAYEIIEDQVREDFKNLHLPTGAEMAARIRAKEVAAKGRVTEKPHIVLIHSDKE
ncbi:MAG: hypothetical protein WC479_00755 [Candidatus Izemoplasmatales bacterium]